MGRLPASMGPVLDAPARRVPLDSGLRLLVSGADLQHLRWSPDLHAPAARRLEAGEIRVEIRGFALKGADVHGCRRLARQRASTHWRESKIWLEVPVNALGVIIESRHPQLAVGSLLWGPMHVGTHRVLRPTSLTAGELEVSSDHSQQTRERFARLSPSALRAASARIPGGGDPRDCVESGFAELRDVAHDGVHSAWFSLRPAGSRPQ
jgi:hypothetical protein